MFAILGSRCRFVVLLSIFLPVSLAKAPDLQGKISAKGSSEPVAGAIISVVGNLGRYDAISDSSGEYRLPLVDQVQIGQEIRLLVYKAGYEVYDRGFRISQETPVLNIQLVRAGATTGARIDDIVFLKSENIGERKLELVIVNPGTAPIFLKRLNLVCDVARQFEGMTGFLTEIDYGIKINGIVDGEIKGEAGPPGDSNKYLLSGWFNFYRDTRRRDEEGWRMSLSCPLFLRIDSKDRFRLRLFLQNGTRFEIAKTEQGSMTSAISLDFVRRSFKAVLLTDEGSIIEKSSDNLAILEWVSQLRESSPLGRQ